MAQTTCYSGGPARRGFRSASAVIRMFILVLALVVGAAGAARAATISYNVTVNTSALAGTQGFLDFQFLPGGLDALPAFAAVAMFASFDAVLAPTADRAGDATGTLPGTVTLGNSQGFNDLFQGITFGSTFSFNLTLSGAALDPGGSALSGTAFSLLLFGADGMTPLVTADPDGRIVSLQIGPNGAVAVSTFPQVNGPPVADVTAAVPEPTTLLLVGAGVVAIAARRRRARTE